MPNVGDIKLRTGEAGNDVVLYDFEPAATVAPTLYSVFMYAQGTLGAGGNPVYPAVGDVDLGVQFGADAPYSSGTLVQPAVGDVRSATKYGAAGTEFTGTMAGATYPVVRGFTVA